LKFLHITAENLRGCAFVALFHFVRSSIASGKQSKMSKPVEKIYD
jgi:hypothetical protein